VFILSINCVFIWWYLTPLLQVTDKLYHTMLYTSPWSRFEPTTSVVIDTDHIDHTITATTTSRWFSLAPLVSSTNKTEILLKASLNTIKQKTWICTLFSDISFISPYIQIISHTDHIDHTITATTTPTIHVDLR
jgi:hypothetical protein